MTDSQALPKALPIQRFLASRLQPETMPENRYAIAALERHKREGMELAVRARIIAMSVIAVMLLFIVPWPTVLYYHALVFGFILIGLLQRRVARVGASRAELALLFCDLLLMTIIALVPNPMLDLDYPLPFQFHFDVHRYFYVLLAVATLAYSWRTVFAVGTWATLLWMAGIACIWLLSGDWPELDQGARSLFAGTPPLAEFLNPTQMVWDQRVEEMVVFLMCAVILGVSMRRFHYLLLEQASAERERANLSRYFSPNVVEQLSQNDDPLKEVRTQDIAVLFVDIVGFTTYSADRPPEEVITTLREFHGRMETEVFRNQGTLDKYLGDGLMATFGTPFAGEHDALNALRCARGMMIAVEAWNTERTGQGEPPIQASFGLHYGPVVLGDIGANRLEFAVIGNTVNVASRLEALSRPLEVTLVASDDLMARLAEEPAAQTGPDRADMVKQQPQVVRGLPRPIAVWTLAAKNHR